MRNDFKIRQVTLLEKGFGGKLSRASINILFVGMLPVIMSLQRTRYVAGIMAVCTPERLRRKEMN